MKQDDSVSLSNTNREEVDVDTRRGCRLSKIIEDKVSNGSLTNADLVYYTRESCFNSKIEHVSSVF